VDKLEEIAEEVTLHFAVSDTGMGIPLERQEVIFEGFTQADNSMCREFGGTGLGLTISSRLLEAMGGRIWLESELGRGSIFHFSVPFPFQRNPLPTADPVLEALAGLAVLVVDDNDSNLRILGEILQSWRMKPTLVQQGEEVLGQLEKARRAGSPFRIVLLDVHMPEPDGGQVADQIMKDSRFAETQLVMLTSVGLRGEAEKCRRLGIRAHVAKPINRAELLGAIKLALGLSQREEKAAQARIPADSQPDTPLSILVAEDNRINQALAVRLLEKRGHRVALAATGRAALEAIEKQSFDLVLMDIQMPEMDGLQATRAIRHSEKSSGKHLPIIAVTANAMIGDKGHCLESGMDGYLSKPLSAKDLFAVIETLHLQKT